MRALVLLLALAPAAAHATPPSRLEVELAWGISGSLDLRTVLVANTLLQLSAPVTTDSAFVAAWGFTVATGEPASDAVEPAAFAAGNPLVGWAMRLGEGLVLTPSFVLPGAHAAGNEAVRPAKTFALEGAVGLRGGLDRWLWRPDKLAFVLPVTWVRWFDPVLLEANLKLGLMVPTRGSTADNDLALQATTRAAWHIRTDLWVSLAASGTWVPTEGGNDASLVIEPEVRYVLEPHSHVALSLVMNLDAPLGPFWEPGRYWGIILGGSAAL